MKKGESTRHNFYFLLFWNVWIPLNVTVDTLKCTFVSPTKNKQILAGDINIRGRGKQSSQTGSDRVLHMTVLWETLRMEWENTALHGEAVWGGTLEQQWFQCKPWWDRWQLFWCELHKDCNRCQVFKPHKLWGSPLAKILGSLLITWARASAAKAEDIKVSTKKDRNRTQTDLDRLGSSKMNFNRDRD